MLREESEYVLYIKEKGRVEVLRLYGFVNLQIWGTYEERKQNKRRLVEMAAGGPEQFLF